MNDHTYLHLLAKCRHALSGGWGVLSTSEKLATALVLNRQDWLREMDYTIAEAIERVGANWVAAIPLVAKTLKNNDEIPPLNQEDFNS